MKRYLLFAGTNYYPAGGWKDFRDSYDSLAEAMKCGEEFTIEPTAPLYDWWHIVDLEEGAVIAWDDVNNTEPPY